MGNRPWFFWGAKKGDVPHHLDLNKFSNLSLILNMLKKATIKLFIWMVVSLHIHYCWWFSHPAPVEVGRLSHYLQGLMHPRWLAGFLSLTVANQKYHHLGSISSRLLPLMIPFQDLVPVLQGLASKTLWQSALELFHEAHWEGWLGWLINGRETSTYTPRSGTTSRLKHGGWKTSLSFWDGLFFGGEMLVLGSVNLSK